MSAATQIRRGAFFIWLTAALFAGGALHYRLLQGIENDTWDMRQQLLARPHEHDPKIKILMIDQSSIDHYARNEQIYWPWPRSLYNPVLQFLRKAGARGVAFDMLFTESSTHVGDDQEFAKTVANSVPVVTAVSLRRDDTSEDPRVEELFREVQGKRRSAIEKYVTKGAAPTYRSATFPIEMLLEASPALGNVTAEADSDKIFRRVFLGAYLGDTPVLDLPVALYNLTNPDSTRGAKLKELASKRGPFIIKFFGPSGTYDTYSIAAVINSWLKIEAGQNPDIPLEEFKDAYVFIGTNAPGLLDLRPIPLVGNYPGVELNATVLDNVMHDGFLREVPLGVSLPLVLAFLALVATVSIRATRYQTAIISAAMSLWTAISFAFAWYGWWIPLVVPLLGALYVLLLIFLLQYRTEGRQHRFIKNAFQHYVTPEVIEQIVKDPSQLSLGGDKRRLTIFFSDIAGFTALSERLEPARLVAFLNKYLSEMTDILLSAEGTIDKYEGDAIIAFWNAPLVVQDHERRAVNAALLCQKRLRDLAPIFKKEFDVDLAMRVGIHSGFVTVGNFGSSTRFNYTIIGDAANLASRLEGVNKIFGTRTLVSGDTHEEAGDTFLWRRVGEVRVVGRREPVCLFEPLDPSHEHTLAVRLKDFDHAMAFFEGGKLREAREIFATFADDPVSQAYCRRIDGELERGGSFSPVWNLTEK